MFHPVAPNSAPLHTKRLQPPNPPPALMPTSGVVSSVSSPHATRFVSSDMHTNNQNAAIAHHRFETIRQLSPSTHIPSPSSSGGSFFRRDHYQPSQSASSMAATAANHPSTSHLLSPLPPHTANVQPSPPTSARGFTPASFGSNYSSQPREPYSYSVPVSPSPTNHTAAHMNTYLLAPQPPPLLTLSSDTEYIASRRSTNQLQHPSQISPPVAMQPLSRSPRMQGMAGPTKLSPQVMHVQQSYAYAHPHHQQYPNPNSPHNYAPLSYDQNSLDLALHRANNAFSLQAPSNSASYHHGIHSPHQPSSQLPSISTSNLPRTNTASPSFSGADSPSFALSPLSTPVGSRRNSQIGGRTGRASYVYHPNANVNQGYLTDHPTGLSSRSMNTASEHNLNPPYGISQSERSSPISHEHAHFIPQHPYGSHQQRVLGPKRSSFEPPSSSPAPSPSSGAAYSRALASLALYNAAVTNSNQMFSRKAPSQHFHAVPNNAPNPPPSVPLRGRAFSTSVATTTGSLTPSEPHSPTFDSERFSPTSQFRSRAQSESSTHDRLVQSIHAPNSATSYSQSPISAMQSESEYEPPNSAHSFLETPKPSYSPVASPMTASDFEGDAPLFHAAARSHLRHFENHSVWPANSILFGVSLPPSLRAAKHSMRTMRDARRKVTRHLVLDKEREARELAMAFLNVPGETVAAEADPQLLARGDESVGASAADVSDIDGLLEKKKDETGSEAKRVFPIDVNSATAETAVADSPSSKISVDSPVHNSATRSHTPSSISTRASSRASSHVSQSEELAAKELRVKLMDKGHQKVFHVPDPTVGLEISEEAVEEVIAAGGGATSALRQVVHMEVHQVKFESAKQLTQAVHILSLPLTVIDMDVDNDQVYITDVSAGANHAAPRELLQMPKEARDYVLNRSKVQNLLSSVLLQHEENAHLESVLTHGGKSSRRSSKRYSGRVIQSFQMDDDNESLLVEHNSSSDGKKKSSAKAQQITMMDINFNTEEEDAQLTAEVESRAMDELLTRLGPFSHKPLYMTQMSINGATDEEANIKQHLAQVIHACFPKSAAPALLRHVMAMQLEQDLQFENVEQVMQALQILAPESRIGGSSRRATLGKAFQLMELNGVEGQEIAIDTDGNPSEPKPASIRRSSAQGKAIKAKTIQLLEQEVHDVGFPQLVSEYVLKHSKVQLELAYIDELTQEAVVEYSAPRPQSRSHKAKAIHLRHTSFPAAQNVADLAIEEVALDEEESLQAVLMDLSNANDSVDASVSTSFSTSEYELSRSAQQSTDPQAQADLIQNNLARKQVMNKLCDADNNTLFVTPHVVMTPSEVASMIDVKQGGAKPIEALKHLMNFEAEKIKFDNPTQLISAVKTLALPIIEQEYQLADVEYAIERANLPAKAQGYVLKHSIVQLEIAKVEKPFHDRKKKHKKAKEAAKKAKHSSKQHRKQAVVMQLEEEKESMMVVHTEGVSAPVSAENTPPQISRRSLSESSGSDSENEHVVNGRTSVQQVRKLPEVETEAERQSSEAHLRNVLKKRLSTISKPFFVQEMAWSDQDIEALVQMGGNSAENVLQHILTMELIPDLSFETPSQFIRTVQLLHMKPVEEEDNEATMQEEAAELLQELATAESKEEEEQATAANADVAIEGESKDNDSSISGTSSLNSKRSGHVAHELKLLDPDEQLRAELEWQEMQVAGLPKAAQEYLMQHFQVELQLAKVQRAAARSTATSRASSRASSKHGSMRNMSAARRSMKLLANGGPLSVEGDHNMMVELVDQSAASSPSNAAQIAPSLTESIKRRHKAFHAGNRAKSIHITEEQHPEELVAFMEEERNNASTAEEKTATIAVVESAAQPTSHPPPLLASTSHLSRADVATLFDRSGAGEMTIQHLADLHASGASFASTDALVRTIRRMHDAYLARDVEARRTLHERLVQPEPGVLTPRGSLVNQSVPGSESSSGSSAARTSRPDDSAVASGGSSVNTPGVEGGRSTPIGSEDVSQMIDMAGGASQALKQIDSLESNRITFDSARQLLSAFKVLSLPVSEAVNLDEVALALEKGHYDQAAVRYIIEHLQEKLKSEQERAETLSDAASDVTDARTIEMMPVDDGGYDMSAEMVGSSSRSSSNRNSRVTSPIAHSRQHSRHISMYRLDPAAFATAAANAAASASGATPAIEQVSSRPRPSHSRTPSTLRQQLTQGKVISSLAAQAAKDAAAAAGSPAPRGSVSTPGPGVASTPPASHAVTSSGPSTASPSLKPIPGSPSTSMMNSPVPVHPATFLLLGDRSIPGGNGSATGSPNSSKTHSPSLPSRSAARSTNAAANRDGTRSGHHSPKSRSSPHSSPSSNSASGDSNSSNAATPATQPSRLDLNGMEGSILTGATGLGSNGGRSYSVITPGSKASFPNSPLRRMRKKGKSVAFSHEEVLHLSPGGPGRPHTRSISMGDGVAFPKSDASKNPFHISTVNSSNSSSGGVSPTAASRGPSLRSSLRQSGLSIIPDSPQRFAKTSPTSSPSSHSSNATTFMSPISASLQILSASSPVPPSRPSSAKKRTSVLSPRPSNNEPQQRKSVVFNEESNAIMLRPPTPTSTSVSGSTGAFSPNGGSISISGGLNIREENEDSRVDLDRGISLDRMASLNRNISLTSSITSSFGRTKSFQDAFQSADSTVVEEEKQNLSATNISANTSGTFADEEHEANEDEEDYTVAYERLVKQQRQKQLQKEAIAAMQMNEVTANRSRTPSPVRESATPEHLISPAPTHANATIAAITPVNADQMKSTGLGSHLPAFSISDATLSPSSPDEARLPSSPEESISAASQTNSSSRADTPSDPDIVRMKGLNIDTKRDSFTSSLSSASSPTSAAGQQSTQPALLGVVNTAMGNKAPLASPPVNPALKKVKDTVKAMSPSNAGMSSLAPPSEGSPLPLGSPLTRRRNSRQISASYAQPTSASMRKVDSPTMRGHPGLSKSPQPQIAKRNISISKAPVNKQDGVKPGTNLAPPSPSPSGPQGRRMKHERKTSSMLALPNGASPFAASGRVGGHFPSYSLSSIESADMEDSSNDASSGGHIVSRSVSLEGERAQIAHHRRGGNGASFDPNMISMSRSSNDDGADEMNNMNNLVIQLQSHINEEEDTLDDHVLSLDELSGVEKRHHVRTASQEGDSSGSPTPPLATPVPVKSVKLFTMSRMQMEEEEPETSKSTVPTNTAPTPVTQPNQVTAAAAAANQAAMAAAEQWLVEKQFSEQTRKALKGFTFSDLYVLEQADLVDLLGAGNAAKLYRKLRIDPPSNYQRSNNASVLRAQNSNFTMTNLNTNQLMQDEDEDDTPLQPLDASEISRRVEVRKKLQRRKIEMRIAREDAAELARQDRERRDAVLAHQREEASVEAERIRMSEATQEFIRSRQEERAAEEEARKQLLLDEIRAKEEEENAIRRKKQEELDEIRRKERLNHLKPTLAAAVRLVKAANVLTHKDSNSSTIAEDGGAEDESGNNTSNVTGSTMNDPDAAPASLSMESAQDYIEFHRAKRAELHAKAVVRRLEIEQTKKDLLTERDLEFQSRVEAVRAKRKSELEQEQRELLRAREAKEVSRVRQMNESKQAMEKEMLRKKTLFDAKISAAQSKAYESESQRQEALNVIRVQHDQEVARRLSEHASRLDKQRLEKSREKALLLKKAQALKDLYQEEASEEIRLMVAARDEARARAAKINQALPYTPKVAGDFSQKLAELTAKLDAEEAAAAAAGGK